MNTPGRQNSSNNNSRRLLWLAHSIKEEMAAIKNVMQQNSAVTVKQTNVYLTPTEREVLEWICQGYTNAEIATARGVSVDRIIKIIQKLFFETQTSKRTELVRWAFLTGYVSPRQQKE